MIEKLKSKAVIDYLTEKENLLEAVVSESGVIFYVDKAVKDNLPATQALMSLRKMVEGELPDAKIVLNAVNPIEFADLSRAIKTIENGIDPSVGAKRESEASAIAEQIIVEGIERDASDFFIDIRDHDHSGRLSYKIFGHVVKPRLAIVLEQELARRVVRAIWTLGGVDWDPSKPCDAAFTFEHVGGTMRVRANSLYERNRGHAVACRIRNPNQIIKLEDAGYTDRQLESFDVMSKASGGLIVIAGPTDSGKSTTLTGIVDTMNHSLRKIEIADPPEVFLDHCVHVEIQRDIDGSYRKLESILGAVVRQNPDVLIIGEIRDRASALAAMGLAQQGKRVLTSVHANGCAGIPPRLSELGIPLNLLGFSGFFAGCASQNLVGVLCQDCAIGPESRPDAEGWIQQFGPGVKFIGPGCQRCNDGLTRQTLVAQVYPLIEDESGTAYRHIERGKFSSLDAYMREELKIEDKHDIAGSLISKGMIDPIDTITRIGSFPGKHYGVKKKPGQGSKKGPAKKQTLLIPPKLSVEKVAAK